MFHTAAVTEELALSLKKREIDKAHKKQNSKKFKNDFRVDVFFKDKKANVLDSMASVRRTGQIDTVAICGTCKNTIFKEELAVETKNQVHHFDCLSCKNSSTFLPFFLKFHVSSSKVIPASNFLVRMATVCSMKRRFYVALVRRDSFQGANAAKQR